ncbi:MAG: hypothetical protein WA102_01790 [Candidatus Methanoperedens sp.]
MPYLFTADARYDTTKKIHVLDNLRDLISNFPFLEGKVISGKFISTHKDGQIRKINKDFKCKIIQHEKNVSGEVLEPNPLMAIGLPLPSSLLVIAYKHEEEDEQKKIELPIAEDIMLKSNNTYPFEDETKRILKEEEAGLILEGTIFHPLLERHTLPLKEALLLFEQENFPSAKTSCRKTLEEIKRIISEWKAVDGSESLCEKLKSIVGSFYSFASIGGPHGGVTTKEETELILKCTTSLLFYVNSLLKNLRVSDRV